MVILGKIYIMRKKILAFLLCILAFGLILTGAYDVSAQNVLDTRLTDACKTELNSGIDFLKNKGNYYNIFDISANLPFTPAECASDNGSTKNANGVDDKYTKNSGTSALPVKYFPFVLLRVYKFMVSLAFYLFGLGIMVLGILMQAGVFAGNYNFETQIKSYFSRAIRGLVTVLFAYYFVAMLLWLFNADSILNTEIIKS
jgi:hypothetical protein